MGSIPRWERYPEEGNSYSLQYFCLDNSTDRRICQLTVHGVTNSQTWLSKQRFSFFFNHLPVDEYLGCFHILAIVSAVTNIGVHVSFWISGFASCRYILRRGIAGSFGSSVFCFLRTLHSIFHSGRMNLHSHQQWIRVAFSPYPHQHLLFVFFLMKVIFTEVKW